MNPAGLSRSVSLGHLTPDMSHINNVQSTLGASVTGVEGSRLQRSNSCPDISGAKLELFSALNRKADMEALISCLKSESAQQKLRDILTQSPNTSAKNEIARFAALYRQLTQNPDLTSEQQGLLLDLAEQYAEKIIADGLGSKSAFGPWNTTNKKDFKKRQELEHKLATLVNEATHGDCLAMGNNFAKREVLPFILSCLSNQFGCGLSDESAQKIVELVDKAAMQALVAVRERYVQLVDEQGMGVGKQARDLETIGAMPLLLRSILAHIPKDLLPDEVDSARMKPQGPAEPAGPEEPAGPNDRGITINIGDINIDNRSYNYDSHDVTTSRNIHGSESGAGSQKEYIDASTSMDDLVSTSTASTQTGLDDDDTGFSTYGSDSHSIESGSQTAEDGNNGDDLSAIRGRDGSGGGNGGGV
ncbi:TPA: hypothetical protein ACPE6X_003701, partial [Providencia rettgeri]